MTKADYWYKPRRPLWIPHGASGRVWTGNLLRFVPHPNHCTMRTHAATREIIRSFSLCINPEQYNLLCRPGWLFRPVVPCTWRNFLWIHKDVLSNLVAVSTLNLNVRSTKKDSILSNSSMWHMPSYVYWSGITAISYALFPSTYCHYCSHKCHLCPITYKNLIYYLILPGLSSIYMEMEHFAWLKNAVPSRYSVIQTCACLCHFKDTWIRLQCINCEISDGYGIKDVVYKWTHGERNSIKMSPDMRLSQFDLIGYPAWTKNFTLIRGNRLCHVYNLHNEYTIWYLSRWLVMQRTNIYLYVVVFAIK